MIIGVTKEIKNNENRVGLVPAGVNALVRNGHTVYVERSAGLGSAICDTDYQKAGAKIMDAAGEVYQASDIIVKVKEPLESEYELIKEGQTLFTYLHLAADICLTQKLLEKKIIGIGYETVTDGTGRLPLLTPMSEVAGRMSIQVGAYLLMKYQGGMGVLLGGVPGVLPATVLIIGGGVVGTNAARMALGFGAEVIILDISVKRLRELDDLFGGRVRTAVYSLYAAAELVQKCDLLISGVLVAGEKAPKVVTEEMVMTMKKGSVIVDVAIDQGGSVETIDRTTSHDNPAYEKHGVIHYSVANMPGSVPKTSTYALTNATLPFLMEMADNGVMDALKHNPHLKNGVNMVNGCLTCKAVADSLGLPYKDIDELL